jgi:peptide/nickel transport system permease protein
MSETTQPSLFEQPLAVESSPGVSSGMRRTRHWDWGLIAGSCVLGAWIVIAIFAPLLAPYNPNSPQFMSLLAPNSKNVFGTDQLGRDVLSRVLYGSRQDLFLAAVGAGVAMFLGSAIGIAVGYSRRWWSGLTMRFFDGLQAFPLLILALALVEALGPGSTTIIIALAVINVPLYVRIVRSQVLTLRERRFIEAAVAAGNPTYRILYRHILPNTLLPIIVQTTITLAYAVLVVAALSFLAVGVPPPTAEWGGMISTGYSSLLSGQWWLAIFPGAALITVIYAFHAIGDGLQRKFAIDRQA